MAVSFPEVLSAVKTRKVTHTMLNGLANYLQNIGTDGLLEEKVVLHLQDLIQNDLERISKTSPKMKNPTLKEVLSGHPCFRNVPSTACEKLQGAAEEVIKQSGVALYREGSNPNGVWLVLNGSVKGGKLLDNDGKISFIFPQGSMLGLFEVLFGKPYICSVITDSVVLCLYLNTEILFSLIKSSPEIERFFWQESAITMAKTLLPQVFQKMSVHEFRNLIADNSTITTYVGGEIIEIAQNSSGLLLDGSLRPDIEKEELILSPWLLLPPPNADQNLSSRQISDSLGTGFCHNWPRYIVENKAILIFFDLSQLAANHNTPPNSVTGHDNNGVEEHTWECEEDMRSRFSTLFPYMT